MKPIKEKIEEEIRKILQEVYYAGEEGEPEESAVPNAESELIDLFSKVIEEIIGEDEGWSEPSEENQFYWQEQNELIRERNQLRAEQRSRLKAYTSQPKGNLSQEKL